MKDMGRRWAAALFVVALGAAVAGCMSAHSPVAHVPGGASSALLSSPPTEFCSPFLASGELTEWAEKAIEVGLGAEFNPVGAEDPDPHTYPDNRLRRYRDKPVYRTGLQYGRKQRHIAELGVRQLGGWEFIDETSDMRFGSAEKLALSLYTDNRTHPRFAEALAAAMQVYPALREEYYQATTGGRWFGYRR
ncbi:MAG: hypothetical protein QG656_174 [Candidatus Hydrogenedentes bacterium]|nr:hypothetical protein [Candidatus Hydrogenedentota bacterium]